MAARMLFMYPGKILVARAEKFDLQLSIFMRQILL
jgi:hypothetical protein